VAVVNLFNFIIYLSIPIVVRYLVLRKPLKSKWITISILLTIFIGFTIVTYRIASSEIMFSYLSAINDSAIERDGKPLTKEEEAYYREKFSTNASKYGVWEAIPAAVIQRQEIKKKIYQDHNITVSTRFRVLGSPILLCVALALSYYVLRKGYNSASSAKNNETMIQRITTSKVTEVSGLQPVCPNCRTEILIDSLYCHKCGNKIAEDYEGKQS
jgi:hypothetical protein